ncbi:tyrosine-type recombinase/integrase [Halomicrobium salinisoli]|uniref:tyrosine-type recombinase/integrase n=1 Tax=Halomicrobium salinisoli TaxID=2878391 RepID=UPI001CF08D1C|nr:tyrosine-type recombinase/integrase [Halomicrobium salinisoli]
MATTEFPDVAQQAIRLYKGDHKEGSVEKFRSNLRKFISWYDENGDAENVAQAGPMEVINYLDHLDDNYAETTVAGHQQTLNHFYRLLSGNLIDAREDDIMEDVKEARTQGNPNTMKRNQTREPILHIEPEEKELLCENVPNPRLRNELLIRMLWQTGMREHEIRNLRIEDIDRDERIITIYSGKTEDSREVPYQSNVETLLSQWLDGGYRDRFANSVSDYVFISAKKKKLTPGSINTVVKKAAESAGIQEEIGTDGAGNTRWKVTTHTLRHSFGIQCVKNGINIRYVQELMGHDDITTTQRYLEAVSNDAVQAAHEKGPGTEQVE